MLQSFTAQHLVELEEEFREFKDHVQKCSTAKEHVVAFSSCVQKGGDLFRKAWEPFTGRFKKLIKFCGGLTTVFPGTATVEADFSILRWERDDYRTGLSYLSLEGTLQAKQISALEKLLRN